MTDSITVLLECGHALEFSISPPLVGDEIWCVRCREMNVVFASEDHWRISCTGCSYGKAFGLDQGQARVAAVRHSRKRGHAVKVKNGRTVVSVVGKPQSALFDA